MGSDERKHANNLTTIECSLENRFLYDKNCILNSAFSNYISWISQGQDIDF